jgi:hypothetical protein
LIAEPVSETIGEPQMRTVGMAGAGEPPQSIAITADGVRLLEECGLI